MITTYKANERSSKEPTRLYFPFLFTQGSRSRYRQDVSVNFSLLAIYDIFSSFYVLSTVWGERMAVPRDDHAVSAR